MSYSLRAVRAGDRKLQEAVDGLLAREGIRRDRNLDYTCILLDELDRPVATGSCYKNTLRCFAVDWEHRGEGLLNEVMLHLTQIQMERGNTRLFLYTKSGSEGFSKAWDSRPWPPCPGRWCSWRTAGTGSKITWPPS